MMVATGKEVLTMYYGRGMGRGMGRGYGGGMGCGCRGSSPPWPYVGIGRGGLPRCGAYGVYGLPATGYAPPVTPFYPDPGTYGWGPYGSPSTPQEEVRFLKDQAEMLRGSGNPMGPVGVQQGGGGIDYRPSWTQCFHHSPGGRDKDPHRGFGKGSGGLGEIPERPDIFFGPGSNCAGPLRNGDGRRNGPRKRPGDGSRIAAPLPASPRSTSRRAS